MNSEVKAGIKILEEAGMDCSHAVGMPDLSVEGCVLIGLKDIKQAFLVYTDKYFDEDARCDFEQVDDWEKAATVLERWEAGLDGEALVY